MPRLPASPDGRRRSSALKLQLRNPVQAPVNRALLRKLAERVVTAEGLSGPSVVGVHLLDDAALRQANRDQRGLDQPTDVLAFPLLDQLQRREANFVLPPREPQHLGDVLISVERARAQAAAYGHSLEREVCFLLAHGVLHLLGHDHVDEEQRLVMRLREEAVLEQLGLRRETAER
jgi:probable rRNA maturation factor